MDNSEQTEPPGLRLDEIYFVLFKHKWKIACFSAAGILAAASLLFIKRPDYQSEAKLFVRYVQENRSVTAIDHEAQIRSPDNRGETIINSEIEILTSFDLAAQVV